MSQLTAPKSVQIAVVGAGPAGLHAAKAAARAGAEVVLIDNNRQPGGQYFRQTAEEFPAAPAMLHQQEGQRLWQEVQAAGVMVMTNTSVWGAFQDNLLALYQPDRPASYLRAKAVVLATGTYERVTPFPGWTLPGVMTVGGAQILMKNQRILPGRKVVLAGTGPLQFVVAAALVEAGAEVVAVLEGSHLLQKGLANPLASLQGLWNQQKRLAEGMQSLRTLRKNGTPVRFGWGVIAAHGTDTVSQVTAAPLDDTWRPKPGEAETFECDTLCLNYGFIPNTELAQLLGATLTWKPEQGGFVPVRDGNMQTDVPGVFVVGDAGGIGGAGLAMVEGEIAGYAAAGHVTDPTIDVGDAIRALDKRRQREARFQKTYAQMFTPGPGVYELATDDTVICRCEEVTRSQIRQAIGRGADTLHSVKSLTRCGMGNCQGRMCGHAVAAVVASETGQSLEEVGYYHVRPPIFPIPLLALTSTAPVPSEEL